MVRVKGTLRRWDDARGFGFIEPDLGGTPVFVHIKAFSFDLPERPQVGQRISYELAPDRQGGERASRAVIELPVAAARSPVRP
ncbi:MAG: cold shock domain-containing protein, partial [Leptothrix sp. (in: b-proteobacteria)]